MPYGTIFVMGSAPSIINGSGDLTIAAKLVLHDLYDGKAGYTPGSTLEEVRYFRFKQCFCLINTNMSDLVGVPNKFRIYR